MTTITLPRATVEQALEALESVYGDSCDALHALRAALAQQAKPQGCDHCNHPLYAATRCRVCGRVTEQAEPVQGWTDADADAARLALELECLLTDKDVPLAAASRWWGSAHEALQLHRKRLTDALAQQAEPVQEPYTDDVTRIMREAGMTFHLGLPHKAVVEQMTRVVDLVYAEASIKAAQQFAAALAQHPDTDCHTQGICQRSGYGIPKP